MMTNQDQIKEFKRQVGNRRRILQEGISEEAMKVLREYFEADLPVFLFNDKQGVPIAGDTQMLVLLAAKRDGALHVIKWLDQERSKPSNEE